MRIRPLTRQHYLALHNRVDSRYICKPHALRHSLKESGHGGRRQTSLCGRLGDLGRVGRRELAVYDGVEDGGADRRVEKARPVAVERKVWGAVNWTRATRRVKGPDWSMPERMLKSIWAWFMVGLWCSSRS